MKASLSNTIRRIVLVALAPLPLVVCGGRLDPTEGNGGTTAGSTTATTAGVTTGATTATTGVTTGTTTGSTTASPFPPVTFTELYTELISSTCTNATAGCHTSTDVLSNLDMSSEAAAYRNLVGVTALGEYCLGVSDPATGAPWIRVVPGNAAESLLYVKVETLPPGSVFLCGSQMPTTVLTYGRPQTVIPLTSAQIAMIYNWIEEGALNN